ncbi:hypothetical protein PR048_006888, partial [Dryococelus australis]
MPTAARLAGVTDLLSPARDPDTFSDDARMFWRDWLVPRPSSAQLACRRRVGGAMWRLLLLLAAKVARVFAADGCPGEDFVYVADGLCLLVTPPGTRDDAVSHCLRQADLFTTTAWQLRVTNRTLFHLVRDLLVNSGVRRVWLEADVAYPGGMFLHGYAGNSLYNSPAWGLDLRGGDPVGACVAWDVPGMSHEQRDCGDVSPGLPAVCLAEFSVPRLEQAGCPEGFKVAPRVGAACLNYSVVEEGGWGWDDAVRSCHQRAEGAHIVRTYFPALYSANLSRSFYNCPLGVRHNPTGTFWMDDDGYPDEQHQVEHQYLRKLLGGSDDADADLVGQVYLYNTIRYLVRPFGPQWRLVDANSTTFNCLACEAPLPAAKKPEMRISVDGHSIKVSVDNPEFLLRTTSWSWSGNGPSIRLVPKIRCYTDALTFYPVQVFMSKIEPNQVVISPVGDGFYWCVSYDVFTTEPVFTDKILFRSPQNIDESFAVELKVSEPRHRVCERFQVLREVMRLKYHVQGILGSSGNFSGPTREDNDTTTRPDDLGPRYRHVYPDARAGDTLAITLFNDRARGRLRRISRDCTTILLHARAPPGSQVAPSIAVDGFYYAVTSSKLVDLCEEDVTDYEWPPTRAGDTVILKFPGHFLKRTCEPNYDTGAFWGEEVLELYTGALETTTLSSEPSYINSTMKDNSSYNDNPFVMLNTSSPGRTSEVPTSASPQELAEFLRSVEAADDLYSFTKEDLNTTGLTKVVKIVNSILKGDINDVIEKSTRPTTMLHDVRTILSKVELEGEDFKMVERKIAVFVTDIERGESEPVRSMILTNRDAESESSLNGSIETGQGSSAGDAISQRHDIDVAVLFPEIEKDARISVAVYSDHRAFRMRDIVSVQNFSVNSRIISIDIDSRENGTVIDKNHSIDIIFRPFENHSEGEVKQCVFWEFVRGYEGRWSSDGCELVNTSGGLDVCRCHHLTHFAEIIMSGGQPISKGHQLALDVISMVGCSLSLAGVVGIVATAVMFPAWRRQLGNKLLLCLSAAVALNMVMFLLIAIGSAKEGVWCIIAGVGLHYSLLASFCWMLVSAWLQYRRLVEVLGTQHVSHLILKVSVFSWGFPSIIVTILLCISPDIYTNTLESGQERGFCFPVGHSFYWGVLAPVVLVVVVNIFIFFAILKSIYNCCSKVKIEKRGFSKRHLNNRRLLTGVLLFFLLGLTWVFGFLSRVSIVFTYLFCITATMQGMVLFLFFIAGEKKMREKWFPKESSVSYSSTRTRRQTLIANNTTGTFVNSSSTEENMPLKANIPLSQITKITE